MSSKVSSAMSSRRQPAARRGSAVSRTLDVIGDGWSFLVLRSTFFGLRRFDQIKEELGISRNVLSERLAHFVKQGILEKHLYQNRPERFEYRLTKKGIELYPIFVAMMMWGDRWATVGHPPLSLHHKLCGCRLGAEMRCSECEKPISASDVTFSERSVSIAHSPVERRNRRSSNPEIFGTGRVCSVGNTLALFADRWSFLVLQESFFGEKRFDEIQKALGIAPNILANRLNSFLENGVMDKRLYQTLPDRYEYVLSAKGRDLYPSILAMMRWGNDWTLSPREKPTLILRHRDCGKIFRPSLCCKACGAEIRAQDVKY